MAAEIGIIGTGAMGCLFGGYLSRRADVTLLTHRKQQAQAIEETGLSIQTDEGPVACGTLRAVCAAEVSEVFDLLVVFVKAFQTRDAIEGIRGCIGPETVILTLQNGIGNGQTLQQLFRPEQILVGTSTINSQRLSDTAVSQHGGMGITTIGSLCGSPMYILTDGIEQVSGMPNGAAAILAAVAYLVPCIAGTAYAAGNGKK